MRHNIIDLIIYMIKRIHIGTRLKDIKLDGLQGYDTSEISAAYSWLIHKHQAGEIDHARLSFDDIPSPRVLHTVERSRISSEAYGYMLELYYLKILDPANMERLIEYSMLRPEQDKVDIPDIKEWVAGMIFDNDRTENERTFFLKGNETIN